MLHAIISRRNRACTIHVSENAQAILRDLGQCVLPSGCGASGRAAASPFPLRHAIDRLDPKASSVALRSLPAAISSRFKFQLYLSGACAELDVRFALCSSTRKGSRQRERTTRDLDEARSISLTTTPSLRPYATIQEIHTLRRYYAQQGTFIAPIVTRFVKAAIVMTRTQETRRLWPM